jgi:hypothetical protein
METSNETPISPTASENDNVSIPYIPNRHERRRLDAQYRKQFGKVAFAEARAEYKQAMAIAKGDIKDEH